MEKNWYDNKSIHEYDVTVLICTYNPDIQKLKRTISSVLLQEDVRREIVISDDGSETFPLSETIDFFSKKNFYNYIIVMSRDNNGIVKNAINGMTECHGTYLKLFSPGDYLYKVDVLHAWVRQMQQDDASLSFSDAIYFSQEDDVIQTYNVRISPQVKNSYYHGEWFYNYLVFDDIALGACAMSKSSVARKYLSIIEGKVKYAEDNIYRLMAADRLKMSYFNRNAILYEYGTGISTSGSNKWNELLNQDWLSANKIILTRLHGDDFFSKNLKRVIRYRENDNFKTKLMSLVMIRGKLGNKIRLKLHPRFSDKNYNKSYVELLFTFSNNA